MIRKGQVRRLAKVDIIGQVRSIEQLFLVAAWLEAQFLPLLVGSMAISRSIRVRNKARVQLLETAYET